MDEFLDKIVARGEARGEIKGAITVYRDEMYLKPEEIREKIMARFALDQETAEKYVEETLVQPHAPALHLI